MRNTTRFNMPAKMAPAKHELKKSSEEYSNFKASHIDKNHQGVSIPMLYREDNKMQASVSPLARTPTKYTGEKKFDVSGKLLSRTPVKYNKTVQNANKTSTISKVSTEVGGEKKMFTSLN